MESTTRYNTGDKQDEVQRLKDMIKNLELENQLLRSRSKKTTGEDDKSLEVRAMTGLSSDVYQIDESDFVNVDSMDFSDEQTWLYKSKKSVDQPTAGASSWNPHTWVRSHVDSNIDFDFQQMRRMLVTKLEDLEQGSRKNNIDTRTFTRPKKRLSRPGLQTMAETPCLTNSSGLSMPYTSRTLTISETLDDISMPFNETVATCLDTTYLNANFQKLEEDCLTTCQLVENTRNVMFQKLEDKGMNSTFRKSEDLLMQNDEWPRSNTNFSKILSEPHLNTTTELRLAPPLSLFKGGSIPDELHSTHNKSGNTRLNLEHDRTVDISAHGLTNTVMQKMSELNATFQVSNCNRSRDNVPPSLDGTFCVSTNERDHHSANKRAASCDSIGDDDYSSASDCSFGVTSGQNNDALGDVQNRARLQEESLKLIVSTPESNHRIEVPVDLPSPIPHLSADGNQGYQSDHSDHSSLAKSSRSSQRSSPALSPFGSTNMLAPVNGYYVQGKHQQLSGTKMISRNSLSVAGQKPNSTSGHVLMSRDVRGRHDAPTQNRPLSGLRPPVVRSQGTVGSALPRPSTNIPRPRSRIPAPKMRNPTHVSQPPASANWMDGCY